LYIHQNILSTNSSAVHVTCYICCTFSCILQVADTVVNSQKSCIEIPTCLNNHCNFLSTISMSMIFCKSVILRNVFSLSHYKYYPSPPFNSCKKKTIKHPFLCTTYPVYKNKSKWITKVSWGMETLMEFITPSLSLIQKKIPI
jgi:hypothetical protein